MIECVYSCRWECSGLTGGLPEAVRERARVGPGRMVVWQRCLCPGARRCTRTGPSGHTSRSPAGSARAARCDTTRRTSRCPGVKAWGRLRPSLEPCRASVETPRSRSRLTRAPRWPRSSASWGVLGRRLPPARVLRAELSRRPASTGAPPGIMVGGQAMAKRSPGSWG